MNISGEASERRVSYREAAGFILAGGQSSRMGRDKALLEFAGQPLIAHAIAILEQAGLSAAIAGASGSVRASLEAFAPVIEDRTPGLGPLSGICAALAATSVRHAVFLPIDLPFLPPSLLKYLLRHAQITGSAVTVPSIAGFAQTFPAVVDCAALPALQNELDAGRRGCFSAFEAAAAALHQHLGDVEVEALVQSGQVADPHGRPAADWFLNLNEPADLSRAEALQSRHEHRPGQRIA